MTLSFLIDNKNPKVFPDRDCWPGFIGDLSSDYVDEYESKFDDFRNYKFDLIRINFKDIIKPIPYMLIDSYLVCPCSFTFKDYFFQTPQLVPPISTLKMLMCLGIQEHR